MNSAWWALVGVAAYLTPGELHKKLRTLLILAGGGAVAAVIINNIKKDKEQNLAEIQAVKQKLYEEKIKT
jgi:hypothetical protein